MRPAHAATMVGVLLMTPISGAIAQVSVVEWAMDLDDDGDGVADGWVPRAEAGGAQFSLAEGGAGQIVDGARAGEGIAREAVGLDPQATYLVTAEVTVAQGGVLWGPEGIREKWIGPYGQTISSRVTFTGRDRVTIAFLADSPGSAFAVSSVRIDRIEKAPLPVEADTGRFLVPRPQRIDYKPGETSGCTLAADTPMAFAAIPLDRVSLSLFRQDLGFAGDPTLRDPGDLADGPAIIVGTPEALRGQADRLPAALGAAAKACPEALREQGYYVAVTAEGVLLAAADEAAAQYGLQALRQLCAPAGEGRWRVPVLTIEDWPALPLRATYQVGITSSADSLARAAYYARLKLNAVVMEDDVLYHLHEGNNLARVREYVQALRDLNLEPIPLVQSFGWGMYVLSIDPTCVEGQYVADRPMCFAAREALPEEVRETLPDDGREYVVTLECLAGLTDPFSNGSFEQLEGDRPAGWQADRWEAVDGATLGVDAVDGDRCLELSRQTKGIVRVWQDFEVEGGANLDISVQVRTSGMGGVGAYAEVYRTTEAGELIGSPAVRSDRAVGDRDWGPLHMTLEPGGHRWFRIYLRIQDGTGTVWFDDLRARLAEDALRNLVHVDESLRVADEAGNAFAEGRDYEVIAGETRFPFVAEAAPWRIARLPGGRIPEGGQVLLSYEYAPPGAVTYCPSDPRTQEIMREALGTVIRELGVSRVHIGHDEPRWMNTCKRCRERGLSNAALFADELTRMNEFAKAADPDVRVMMWADALNPYHNAPAQQLEPANDTTPKDLIECTWFYAAADDVAEARSLAYMANRGYETTGSPWFDLENNWDWAQECNISRQMTGKCLGMVYTSWGDYPEQDAFAGLSVTAAFSWNPDDPQALEMLPWSPAEMNRTFGVLP